MTFLKDLCLTCVLLVTLIAVGQCTACVPAQLSPATATCPAVSGSSVVTLVREIDEWQWAPLSSELDASGFHHRWAPHCNAFAVRGPALVTAAHCVSGAKVGDAIRYRAPNGVGLGVARLTRLDEAHDNAVLSVDPGEGLEPLRISAPPPVGVPVLSVSSLYGATSRGRVIEQLGSGYFETSQTIVLGWSGSPALDEHGRVWGVVRGCSILVGAAECSPGRAFVAPLPGGLVP